MNVGEVKTTVRSGTEAVTRARMIIVATADRVAEDERLVAVTRGSDHLKVEVARRRLAEAAAEARRVRELLSGAAAAADEFHRALG